MAYQFADGFDNYGNNFTMLSGYPWDFTNNAASITSTTDFRFAPPNSLPGGCVVISGLSNILRKNLSGNFSTVVVGFGYKIPALPASGAVEICQFSDAGTIQCALAVNSVGALQFYRGSVSGGTAIGTISPNGTIVANTWYGMAMQVTVATGTAGSVLLYLNGSNTPVINSTGLNTSADANNFCNQISLGPQNQGGLTAKYDDFFCFDTTGGFQNSLPGSDVRILTELPASAGNYTNWTPTGLASNFQNVAVQPPSTSDYNANNTATTKDSYLTSASGLSVAPYFVAVRASMERDDAGPHTPSIFVRSGSSDSTGVTTPALTSSYLFYDALFQTDPATSVAWTGPGADNAQIGIIEG